MKTNPLAPFNTQEIVNLSKKVQALVRAPEWQVCVADAHFGDAKMTVATLEAYGFQNVELALSGQEVSGWLQTTRGQRLLFSSNQLPDMNFADLARFIMSDPHCRETRLILLDHFDDETQKACQRNGATYCFQKPLTEALLIQLLQELPSSDE